MKRKKKKAKRKKYIIALLKPVQDCSIVQENTLYYILYVYKKEKKNLSKDAQS